MASGVKLAEEVKHIFTEMKVVKSVADENERIRLVTLIIDTDIKVEKIYRQKDLENEDVFKYLQKLLLADQCRYILYDCHFDTKESSKKEELVFIFWAPEGATMRSRMCYASSKPAMDKLVEGVKHKLQINFIADFDRDCFIETLGKDVTTLEGQAVGGSCAKKGHGEQKMHKS